MIFESVFIQIHSCSNCICAICCSKLLQPAVFRDLKSYRKNRMRFNKSQSKDQTLSQLFILSLKWNVEWFEKFVFFSTATLKVPRNKPLQMAQTNGVKTQTTVSLSENLLKFFAIDLFWLDFAWFHLTWLDLIWLDSTWRHAPTSKRFLVVKILPENDVQEEHETDVPYCKNQIMILINRFYRIKCISAYNLSNW